MQEEVTMVARLIGSASMSMVLVAFMVFLPRSASAVELVDLLTGQLGISAEQAAGCFGG